MPQTHECCKRAANRTSAYAARLRCLIILFPLLFIYLTINSAFAGVSQVDRPSGPHFGVFCRISLCKVSLLCNKIRICAYYTMHHATYHQHFSIGKINHQDLFYVPDFGCIPAL